MKNHLSRRAFLRYLLFGGALPYLPKRLFANLYQNQPTVIIVGAGVAGLTAGQTLRDMGYSVIILEARERYGGRIWTARQAPHPPLDLGASWVHGIRNNPITALAKPLHISWAITDHDNRQYYLANDGWQDDATMEYYDTLYSALMDLTADISEDDDSLSLADAVDIALDELTDAAFDKTILRHLVQIDIENEYATDLNNLSAVYWDADEAFGGDDVLFPDGYDWLPAALADGLDIRYNTPVQIIRYDQNGVVLEANGTTFYADFALITVPLGVLKDGLIRFDPPLPSAKQRAIENLHMGVLDKLYLQFPHIFWDNSATWLSYIRPDFTGWREFLNLAPVINQPVLLGFIAGSAAIAMEARADTLVVDMALDVLQQLYGPNIPQPTYHRFSRWYNDVYSRGSYSSYGIHSSPADRRALEAPILGRLFFAGEATHSRYPATVHGALLSGRQAAQKIQATSAI